MAKGRVKKMRIRKVAAGPVAAFEATPERLAQATDRDDAGKPVAAHMSLVIGKIEKAGERALLTRRFADSYIDRIRGRHITFAQWYAADWYRDLYQQAGIEARVSANYGGSGAGECTYGMAVTERQAWARRKLRAARERIPPNMIGLIDRVVLHDAVPVLSGGVQRARFASRMGAALQPLAEWINAPATA